MVVVVCGVERGKGREGRRARIEGGRRGEWGGDGGVGGGGSGESLFLLRIIAMLLMCKIVSLRVFGLLVASSIDAALFILCAKREKCDERVAKRPRNLPCGNE